jgi:hypothetical protein
MSKEGTAGIFLRSGSSELSHHSHGLRLWWYMRYLETIRCQCTPITHCSALQCTQWGSVLVQICISSAVRSPIYDKGELHGIMVHAVCDLNTTCLTRRRAQHPLTLTIPTTDSHAGFNERVEMLLDLQNLCLLSMCCWC